MWEFYIINEHGSIEAKKKNMIQLKMTWRDTLILKPRLSLFFTWRLFIQQWWDRTSPLTPNQLVAYSIYFLWWWLANLNSLSPHIYLIHQEHQSNACLWKQSDLNSETSVGIYMNTIIFSHIYFKCDWVSSQIILYTNLIQNNRHFLWMSHTTYTLTSCDSNGYLYERKAKVCPVHCPFSNSYHCSHVFHDFEFVHVQRRQLWFAAQSNITRICLLFSALGSISLRLSSLKHFHHKSLHIPKKIQEDINLQKESIQLKQCSHI